MLHFPGWTTMLAGYFIPERELLYFNWDGLAKLNFAEILMLMLILMTAMGAAAILNQLSDVASDRLNNKLFIIAEGMISKRGAVIEAILLIGISLTLSFLMFPIVCWFILFSLLIAGYAYNYKPFALKDRPFSSLIANSLMGWLVFAIGWASRQPLSLQIITDSLPYFFFNGALYFYTTLPDITGDEKSAKHTFAVLLGIKPIIRISFLFYLTSLYSAIVLNDKLAFFFIVLSLPFFLLTIVKNDLSCAVRTTKYSILFSALAVCLKLPYYLALMIMVFFITRWYFRVRFNYNYPNFKG
jgi:4-hydroxybenzoate polyprenyltransferase